MSVAIVGSINTDLTSYLQRWPEVGETVQAAKTAISLGGKGANQAMAVAKLGVQAHMLGAIGKDGFGQDARAALAIPNLHLTLVECADVTTGMAFIDVVPSGDNIIRISKGANWALTPEAIHSNAKAIAACKTLLLQNEIPFEASRVAAKIARTAGATVIMDPAPAPSPVWPREDLALFDILTPNAQEAALLTEAEPETLSEGLAAARKLRDRVNGAIVTMGSTGVAWSIGTSEGQIPAPRVTATDTVGAGDCFNGAFAAALSEGQSIKEAITLAAHAGALATTRKGASTSLPNRDELRIFMAENSVSP